MARVAGPKPERIEAFCRAHLTEPNASEAFRLAFPHSCRWKAKTVHEHASRLLANGKVQTRLRELRDEAADRAVVEEADILKSALRAMNADPRLMFDAHEKLLPPSQWPDAIALAVDSFEIREERLPGVEGGTRRISRVKLTPRSVAREQLMRHLGMFGCDNAQRQPPAPPQTSEGIERDYAELRRILRQRATGIDEPEKPDDE